MKCKCCNKEITREQWQYCRLCGLCDTGVCRRPSEYHKLEKEIEGLLKLNAPQTEQEINIEEQERVNVSSHIRRRPTSSRRIRR